MFKETDDTIMDIFNTRTPDEVSRLSCDEAPNINFNAEILYEDGFYHVFVENEDGEWFNLGHFPSDVVPLMLCKYEDARIRNKDEEVPF